jgi:hypothetical protein
MKKNKKKTGFIASLKLQAVLTSPTKITRPIVGPGFAYIIFIVHDIKVLVCKHTTCHRAGWIWVSWIFFNGKI